MSIYHDSHHGDVYYGYSENKIDASKVLSKIWYPQNWNPHCQLTTILVVAVLCIVASVCSIVMTVISSTTASKVSAVNEMDDKKMELHSSLRQNLTVLVDAARSRQADITNQLKAKRLSIANLYTHLSLTSESTPASSCSHILQTSSTATSGYHWVRARNGSSVRVYCDMTRICGNVTGGWMEVAHFDFGAHSSCPSGFTMTVYEGVRSCRYESNGRGCGTMTFDSLGIAYTKVCGKVIGYQKGSTNAFDRRSRASNTPDSNFVDGVILSHANPRTVIWTFAAALSDTYNFASERSLCACTSPDVDPTSPPRFVGKYYFCDAGYRALYRASYQNHVVTNNPLWDGAGCNTDSSCCGFNNPPWFFRELRQEVTANLDMKVCRDESWTHEDVSIAEVKIYIQ